MILPATLNLSKTLSNEIFSTSRDILILTLSPLSGLAYSLSCFITLVVVPTIRSPALIILRSVSKSSDSSGIIEIELLSKIFVIIYRNFIINIKK